MNHIRQKYFYLFIALLILQTNILANLNILPKAKADPNPCVDGVVLTDFADLFKPCFSRDIIQSSAIQTDGKIVVGGISNPVNDIINYALARYNTNGKLDNSFGNKGLVTTNVGAIIGINSVVTFSFLNSLLIQANGKIIGAGSFSQNKSNFSLVRYNTDGSIDTSFGTNGAVVTDVGSVLGFQNTSSSIFSVILQSNKILAGGFSDALNATGGSAFARYNLNGNLDTTFGTNGVVLNGPFLLNSNIVLQSTGKIVGGGVSKNSFALIRYNPNGTIDNTFGINGIVVTPFTGFTRSFITGIAIQNDNIIAGGQVIKGNTTYFTLVKYNNNGSINTSFGTNGIVNMVLTPAEINIRNIGLQSNGKIITGGINTNNLFALTRLNVNGTLDTTFGHNGIMLTQFSSKSADTLNSISIASDDKIVACGSTTATDNNKNFATANYNVNGSLNSAFGNYKPGLSINDFKKTLNITAGSSNSTTGIVQQSNGKIVATGFTDALDPNYNFAMCRYDLDGNVDMTFTPTSIDFSFFIGAQNATIGSYDIQTCSAVQRDDKIIGAGYSNVLSQKLNFVLIGKVSQIFSFALTRVQQNGLADNSFGKNSLVVTNFGLVQNKPLTIDNIRSITIQTNNKIVAGGNTSTNGINSSFALARYNNNGSLDTNYGTLKKGIVITNIGQTLGLPTSFDTILSIALQNDNKIIAAGVSTAKNPLGDFTLARYNTNGTLDQTFGDNGIVITNFSIAHIDRFSNQANATNTSQINKVVVLSNGKILAGGITSAKIPNFNPNNPRFNFAFAQYNTDGTLDKTFGNNGLVVTVLNPHGNNTTSNDYLSSFAVRNEDGKIIAGGASNAIDPNYSFALAVYNFDGKLDPLFGNNGIMFTDFRQFLKIGINSQDSINTDGVLILKDGNALAAGSSNATNPNFDFALKKYIIPADLIITSPKNGSTVDTNQPLISGIAPAGSVVKVRIDNILISTIKVGSSGRWSTLPPSPLKNGLHTILATATVIKNKKPITLVATVTFTVRVCSSADVFIKSLSEKYS